MKWEPRVKRAHLALKEVQDHEATLDLKVYRGQLVSLDHQDPLDKTVMQEPLEQRDVMALLELLDCLAEMAREGTLDQVDQLDPEAHQDLEGIQVLQGHRDPKDLLDHQVHKDSQDQLDLLDPLVHRDQLVHEGIPDPEVIPDHEEMLVLKAHLVQPEIKVI